MKKRITIKDLARELDVSVSTVSKALRDSSDISKETISKIKAFAKQVNYKPNYIAQSLKNQKTKTIGVIIPDIVHHFFTKVIKGIENLANRKGYNIIIGLSNESLSNEIVNMEMLTNGSIDGLIISVSRETMQKQNYHHIYETLNQGIPIVMFDRIIDKISCDKVTIDDKKSTQNAVDKLIQNGAKKIAIITTKDYMSVGKLRTEGYKIALKQNNIKVDDNLIIEVDDDLLYEDHLESLEFQIQKMFNNCPRIDGIFAVNELFATVAMKIAKNIGINVPDDLQIIGFTDGILSRHASPPLSTVNQHGESMGEKATNILISRIENKSTDNYRTHIIQTDLILRDSTK